MIYIRTICYLKYYVLFCRNSDRYQQKYILISIRILVINASIRRCYIRIPESEEQFTRMLKLDEQNCAQHSDKDNNSSSALKQSQNEPNPEHALSSNGTVHSRRIITNSIIPDKICLIRKVFYWH